jgi:arylsulfatase A-like enzyme
VVMKRFFCTLVLMFSLVASRAAENKPNIIFILTDNHGAWTLGCYGNKEIQTPNIDRLASEGMLFTRAYCNNSVCSPSRATFLTGLIPSQHGVHAYIPQTAQIGPDAYGVIKEFRTLPGILADSGYACGLSGKWHLGDVLKPQLGFTYWFSKASGHTAKFYNDEMVWQGKTYKEPRYTTDVITEHAIDFLEQNKSKPFFLYLAYNGPYGLGQVVKETHKNRWTDFYKDKPMTSFPREKVSPWLKANRFAVDNLTSMRSYAAEVSGVDDGIGRVMEKLRGLGLDKNTLIIFAADQGLNAGHSGYWGMGDHSRPINTCDATVRIPLIFWKPGEIAPATTSDLMVENHDFMATVLDFIGNKAPQNTNSPGKSFAPALRGKEIKWDNVIYHEFENTRMVRTERYKLTIRHPYGPDELYDMQKDPGERENLIHVEGYGDVRRDLTKKLRAFFSKYVDPKYDRWNGGVTKGNAILREE